MQSAKHLDARVKFMIISSTHASYMNKEINKHCKENKKQKKQVQTTPSKRYRFHVFPLRRNLTQKKT